MSNQRTEPIEKTIARITGKNHAEVAVEDLNINDMTKKPSSGEIGSDTLMIFYLLRLKAKCALISKWFVKASRR